MQDRPKSKRRVPRSALARAIQMYRAGVERRGIAQMPRLAYEFLLRSPAGQRVCRQFFGTQACEFTIELPPGYPARRLAMRISIPPMPASPLYTFAEHPLAGCDKSGTTVLVVATGGFAVSEDLGSAWRQVRPEGYAKHEFVNVKSLGQSEYLAQAVLPQWRRGERLVDMLVLNADGDVLAANRLAASPWHACRAIDISQGTLMFAEYPYERAGWANESSRVFRSRDRGRSWHIVFEQSSSTVRHFHFLQSRPGKQGEWWLTSGDRAREVHVWISRDDGDSWAIMANAPEEQMVADDVRYPRSLFCLTDLAWLDGEAVWGTDDVMPMLGGQPRGAKVLRMRCEPGFAKHIAGTTRFPVRNMVDIGAFWLFLTQGSLDAAAKREERGPGVYLMPKQPERGAPELVHLFDVDTHSAVPTAFSYSRASRAAHNGVFFTARSGTDMFPCGHRLLKWEVSFS